MTDRRIMRSRHMWGLLALSVLVALAFSASMLLGPASIEPRAAATALFGAGDNFTRAVVLGVRLPRALAALTVGSLLGLAGVLLQALFRNPLADPFVLGVSGGAAVGALLGMLTGAGFAVIHGSAIAGGVAAGILTLLLGRGGGGLRLLLCGVVLASTCGAAITVLLTLADTGQVRGMVFWLAGDLGWAQYPMFNLGVVGAALALSLLLGRVLNVLGAGELRSSSVGLDARAARLWVFLLAAALTALAVVSAGTVGFVGLIAPHTVRLAFRTSDHRIVAPGAALMGGLLLCVADILSRTIAAPRELPVGAITALIGAPLFIVLLRRSAS
ncbi:MAG: FecCD family ABC transporter permease [Steroidobacterales bacterium]